MPRFMDAMFSDNSPELEAECRRMEDEHERDLEARWDAYCEEGDHKDRIEEQKKEFEQFLVLPGMKDFTHRLMSAMDKWQMAESDSADYEQDAYRYYDKLYKTLVVLLEPKYGFYKAIERVNDTYLDCGDVPENKFDHLYKGV